MYRTGNRIGLLFQVNNDCTKENSHKNHCWSTEVDWTWKMDKKEESIPSCSSNRRNSLVAVAAVPGEIHLQQSSSCWTGD